MPANQRLIFAGTCLFVCFFLCFQVIISVLMDRNARILFNALDKGDKDCLQFLQIPKYESTKGTEKSEREAFTSRFQNYSFVTPELKVQDQIMFVSSTEKQHETRFQKCKKNLFADKPKNSLEECSPEITSTLEETSDIEVIENNEDSGSEYIPDSASENSESETEFERACNQKPVNMEVSSSGIQAGIILENLNTQKYQTQDQSEKQSNKNSDTQAFQKSEVQNSGKKNKRAWNKKDYCIFCNNDVMKFSRHILRHHSEETSVQNIISLPLRDKKRKNLFNKLRNEGNFIKSCVEEHIVPVRMPEDKNLEKPNTSTYLPCTYCKGFYKRRFLYRHVNKCPHNTDEKKHKINAQADGQSLISSHRQDTVLRKEVFPKMRPDKISFVAKTDHLICAVETRYLKSHRGRQFHLVASRKMRQLAALLLEIQKTIKVKNFLEVLDPLYFDVIVTCTKIISKYDPSSETFGAPSLASNMGTQIKECVDVAYNLSLRKYHTETEGMKKMKALKDLISSEWQYEVSTLANHDLNQKKWNKPSLVPLAEDLNLLKTYLLAKGEKCRNALQGNPCDEKAFKTLQEVCYIQLLLLNRRRAGELQRITAHCYSTNINKENPSEFDNCISESEKLLMKSFKRVVIRGKRGRGVPVLFTEEIIKNSELLLKYRSNFVPENNKYLLANTKSSNTISGTKALYTHVRLAGVKNAAALTSTKLRKHLATMSQVINLSEQDLEQLATFMGHTSDIHKTYYRLPNDVYQMAKVSKLLLLNERGEAAKYQGKSLDEININLDPIEDESDGDADEVAIDERPIEEINDKEEIIENAYSQMNKSDTKTVAKKKRILEPWTETQKQIVVEYFRQHIRRKIPPKKNECLTLKGDHLEALSNKSWQKIKIYIVNFYNGKLKN